MAVSLDPIGGYCWKIVGFSGFFLGFQKAKMDPNRKQEPSGHPFPAHPRGLDYDLRMKMV